MTRISLDNRWIPVDEAMVLFNTTRPGVYNLAKRHKWRRRTVRGTVRYSLADALATPRTNARSNAPSP